MATFAVPPQGEDYDPRPYLSAFLDGVEALKLGGLVSEFKEFIEKIVPDDFGEVR